MNANLVEVLGMFASVVVLLSFTQSNVKRIRCINILGAVLYVVYGMLLGSISVCFLNAALVFIHIYKMRKEST